MKSLAGKVLSNKMNKTVVVAVETRWQHPVYRKTVRRTKKYLVHDELGAVEGQQVTLVPCRPISRRKCWKIVSIDTTAKKI